MKKILILTLALVMLVTGCFALVACNSNADYKVGVIQLAPHVALDQANEAFCQKLTDLMKADGKTVDFIQGNAQGDDSQNGAIVDGFIGKQVDLVYSIATASSQTAVTKCKDYEIPVIFNAVTDPVDAGLVDKLEGQSGNVTGVSDINPIADQVALMQELLGGGTEMTIGVLYVTKETNSVVQMEAVRTACEGKGIAFVSEGISEVDNIGNGLQSLKSKGADIVYLPTDNVLAESATTVHAQNVSLGVNLPIVCGESGMANSCGVATLSVSYTYLGELAAQMAYDILTGKKAAKDIPVGSQTQDYDYVVNQKVAEEIGFTIPQSVVDKVK